MNNPSNTTSDTLEVEEPSVDFWNLDSEALENGTFWANRIKDYKGESAKRLTLAIDNLPLPASFREAAIATRALIREKRKIKESYDEQLHLLYWLAAINSFSITHSEKLNKPDFNVIESIPGKKLKSLPFTYQTLGYSDLGLLNKTDVKWLIEAWGEPKSHNTLYNLHINIWEEYEDKLLAKQNSNNDSSSTTEPEIKLDLEPTSKPEAESRSKPEAESRSKPEAESRSKPEAESRSKPEAESRSKPEAESRSEPEAESTSEPEAEETIKYNVETPKATQKDNNAKTLFFVTGIIIIALFVILGTG